MADATKHAAPSRRFDAVLFDHDGTVINSLPVVVAATNSVLRQHGFREELPTDIIAGMVLATTPRMGHHARITDMSVQERMAADFYAEALRLGPQLAKPYDGIPELINQLAQRGCQQGIISNNQGNVVRLILSHHGLASSFALMYGEDDFAKPKPDPSGLLQAADVLQIPINRCIYVGDSENDSEAARAANMTSVGVTWGIYAREKIAELGFTHIIDHPSELLALL